MGIRLQKMLIYMNNVKVTNYCVANLQVLNIILFKRLTANTILRDKWENLNKCNLQFHLTINFREMHKHDPTLKLWKILDFKQKLTIDSVILNKLESLVKLWTSDVAHHKNRIISPLLKGQNCIIKTCLANDLIKYNFQLYKT